MTDPRLKHPEIDYTRKTRSPLKMGTWVMVADGEKALLLENIGDAETPRLEVRREEVQDNPPSREQGTHAPGRYNDGPQVQRSAVQDTDWHWLAKERFAADLADLLLDQVRKGRFERIILVAGPKLLGELRRDLHKEVTDKVVAEADLTLTNHTVDDMARRIAEATTPES